jgi:hypothetical protein
MFEAEDYAALCVMLLDNAAFVSLLNEERLQDKPALNSEL